MLDLRDNTERPETITIGTNELSGTDSTKLPSGAGTSDGRTVVKSSIPQKWDRQGTYVQTTEATSDFILKCSLPEDKRIEPKHLGEQIPPRASDRLSRRV